MDEQEAQVALILEGDFLEYRGLSSFPATAWASELDAGTRGQAGDFGARETEEAGSDRAKAYQSGDTRWERGDAF